MTQGRPSVFVSLILLLIEIVIKALDLYSYWRAWRLKDDRKEQGIAMGNCRSTTTTTTTTQEPSSSDRYVKLRNPPDPPVSSTAVSSEGTATSSMTHDSGFRGKCPRSDSSFKSKAKAKAGSDVICHICGNHGGDVIIPISKVTKNCPPGRTLCEDCLRNHIKHMVLKQVYTDIRCICVADGECDVRYDHGTIRKNSSKDTFERYDVGLLHETLERDPEFCWCANSGCGSGQLHGRRHNYPRMKCHHCRRDTCFTHRCEWHVGRTCRQYEEDAARSDEVSLLQFLSTSDFRRCPSCNHGIEKKGGCSHMTCRCKHEFCWHCLAPYKGDNGILMLGSRGHKKSCQRYKSS